MLSKKIISLILSAAALTPAAITAIEAVNPECAEAATEFVSMNDISCQRSDAVSPLYGIMPLATGDVNGDGKVDMLDYALLKSYIEHDGENIKINEYNSDLNYDNEINILDLLALKSKL